MGIRQPQLAKHQKDRNRDRDGRHHPRREDEEEQIVLERNLEPRERIGGQGAQKDGQEGRAEPDDDRVDVAAREARRPRDDHVAAADQLVVPDLGRREAGHVLRRLTRAGGEEVHVAFERGLEHDLGRIGDRIGRCLETGEHDPDQRDHRRERVGHDDHSGKATDAGGGLGDGMGVRLAGHRRFTAFITLT